MPTRSSSSSTRSRTRLAIGVGIVQADGVADLARDALHRIERVERPLEDERDLRPAQVAHAALGAAVDVHDAVRRSPGRSCPRAPQRPARSSCSTASAVVVLPQPDSPARPSASPRRSSNETPVTISTSRSPDAVADAQVVHAQHGIVAHRSRTFGSAISSMTWPTAKNASTKSVIARPGGTTYHHAPGVDRSRLEAVVELRPPRERVRVAEAEVREARLARAPRARRSARSSPTRSASRWAGCGGA